MGLARAVMKHAGKVEGLVDVVDIVGTIEISTGTSILVAACSLKFAKGLYVVV